jgi:hypothetical protein
VTRWKAAGLHFLICLLVATSVILVMLAIWYPRPLFEAMGGERLVMILIGVDVIIGPLITLIVFTPGKPLHLIRFDLTVIGCLQLAALSFGVYVVFEARPVYVVFARDRFEVTTANEIQPAEQAKVTRPEFAAPPLWGPKVIGVEMPRDPDEQLRIALSGIAGADLKTFPQYFVPYAEHAMQAAARARPVALLRASHPESKGDIEAAVAATGRKEDELGYLPLRARLKDMAVLVDAKDGKVMGIVQVDPW